LKLGLQGLHSIEMSQGNLDRCADFHLNIYTRA